MNTYDYEDALFRIDPNLRDFRDFKEKFEDLIVNSFVMVEKIGTGQIYDIRFSNQPIESINRNAPSIPLVEIFHGSF